MLNIRNAITLTLLAAAAAWVGAAEPKTPASPSSKLDSMAWIAGTWRADVKGDQLDEIWSAPAGDSMFGAFRWMKGGKTWMFEMLTLIVEGDDLVLRIKHFDNKGVGWEEKDDAVTLKLIRNDGQKAEFERIQSDKDTKVVYHRTSPTELVVSLERTTKDGPKKDEFRFQRISD